MVRINAILPEDTLVKIDAIVKEKKKSRSGFLREAAEKLIDEYQRQKAEEIKRERIKRAIEIQDKLKEKNQASGMVLQRLESGENQASEKICP